MSLRRIFPSLSWPLFALFLMLTLNLSFARISRLPCNKVQLLWNENFYNFLHCVPGPELKLRDTLNNTSPVFAPCQGIQNSLGIWNTTQGIRNPTNDWNPESKFHWQRIRNQVNGIRNQWCGIQNTTPRIPDSTSKNFPDSRIWIPLHRATVS